jgi:putative redox protein
METKSGGVEMTATGKGGLHVSLQHGPSGTQLVTDAPKDNGGEGSSFSPTDLVAAAAASCALTTMALVAKRENIPWGEASARVEKHMTPPPRRIGELVLELTMPRELPADQRTRMEKVAHECPVARSLAPDTKLTVSFRYR